MLCRLRLLLYLRSNRSDPQAEGGWGCHIESIALGATWLCVPVSINIAAKNAAKNILSAWSAGLPNLSECCRRPRDEASEQASEEIDAVEAALRKGKR